MLRRVAVRSGLAPVTENVAAPAAMALASRRDYTTERSYGNLKDSDRIFTNLYGEHDIFIKGALARVPSASHDYYLTPPLRIVA